MQEEPTIGRLVADASRDVSTLISKEIELAKSELKVSLTAGGIGIALFAVAGFLLLLAIVVFSIAVAYFINWDGQGLALKWSFLIVFGFYVLLAGLLALVGVKKIKKVRAPAKAISQAQQLPAAFKGSHQAWASWRTCRSTRPPCGPRQRRRCPAPVTR